LLWPSFVGDTPLDRGRPSPQANDRRYVPSFAVPVSAKSFAGHRNPIGTAASNTVTTTANTRSARLHFFQSATKSRIALPSAATGPPWAQ
jgi:hypothetical protein